MNLRGWCLAPRRLDPKQRYFLDYYTMQQYQSLKEDNAIGWDMGREMEAKFTVTSYSSWLSCNTTFHKCELLCWCRWGWPSNVEGNGKHRYRLEFLCCPAIPPSLCVFPTTQFSKTNFRSHVSCVVKQLWPHPYAFLPSSSLPDPPLIVLFQMNFLGISRDLRFGFSYGLNYAVLAQDKEGTEVSSSDSWFLIFEIPSSVRCSH